MSGKHWTHTERQRQSERIKEWKPWERSTGPKSKAGKQKVAQNAFKGGFWLQLREIRKQLNQLDRETKSILKD